MDRNFLVWSVGFLMACGGGGGGKSDAVDSGTGTPDTPASPDALMTQDTAAPDPGSPETGVNDIPSSDAGYVYPTCVELLPCTMACGDDPCRQKCLAGASPQALSDIMALKSCIDKDCPVCNKASPTPDEQENCESCRSNAIYAGPCGDAYEKCGTFGNSSCGEAWACVKDCPDDPCADGCMEASTFKAHKLSLPLMNCISNACPGQDQLPWNACMDGAIAGTCKTQWDACQNDQ